MLEPIPRIVRSLHAIGIDQPELRLRQVQLRQTIIDELSRLLGGRIQAAHLLAVYDGTVDAGPRPEGGWLVHANLPSGTTSSSPGAGRSVAS